MELALHWFCCLSAKWVTWTDFNVPNQAKTLPGHTKGFKLSLCWINIFQSVLDFPPLWSILVNRHNILSMYITIYSSILCLEIFFDIKKKKKILCKCFASGTAKPCTLMGSTVQFPTCILTPTHRCPTIRDFTCIFWSRTGFVHGCSFAVILSEIMWPG